MRPCIPRGSIPPHIADVPDQTTFVEVDLKRNPADQRPEAAQKMKEHKMQPRDVKLKLKMKQLGTKGPDSGKQPTGTLSPF